MERTNTSTFVFIVKGELAGVYEKNLLFLFTKIRTSLDFPKLKCGEINIYCTVVSATGHCVCSCVTTDKC
jgi:hypothetical protein